MTQVPLIKSRNFNSHDVCRGANSVDDVTMYLTGYAHGCAQALRTSLALKYGEKFKGLEITSSNRAAYNDTVDGAAKKSHHIWRLDADGSLHVAMDLKPLGITLQELYDHTVATCLGEIYLNIPEGIVHYAPVPQETQHWIKYK